MLTAYYFGYRIDLVVVALLMGGSVVGIAYQLEKKIRFGKVMAWKILVIMAGFSLAYNIIYFSWFYLISLSAIIALLFFIFFS